MTPQDRDTLKQVLTAVEDGDATTAQVLLKGLLGSTDERTETIYRVQRQVEPGKHLWGKDKRDYSNLGHVKSFIRHNNHRVDGWDIWVGSITWTRMSPNVVESLI